LRHSPGVAFVGSVRVLAHEFILSARRAAVNHPSVPRSYRFHVYDARVRTDFLHDVGDVATT
jgi:hypothetical protein